MEKCHIVIGADESNIFVETLAPKASPYMHLDHQFHSWRHSKRRLTIPKIHRIKVLRVKQGHPESPRLWATLRNKMIIDFGFTPCKHKSYLYRNPNYRGTKVQFLQQGDDFTIRSLNQDIAHKIIN